MSLYFFYQEKEKSRWLPALASERQNIIKAKKPALVSVLDADNDFSDELNIDDIRAVKYSGPMYFDFDAADLEEATQQFQKFLINLKAKGVNLEMLRLFATGKKGYHIEVPAQMLMGKVPPAGVQYLPYIFKEIAHALYVDTLDLRVYSAKRGRMWRCPNVEREDNGKFKVQLTVDEAFAMTGESYMQVCSSPRNSLPTEPPALCQALGLLWAQSKDKVEKGIGKAKKSKNTANALEKFKGVWPDTLTMILQGVGIKPDVGWNHISMQLATTAAALGKSEDSLLEDAAPIIEGHTGDSDRYGSPRKRRDDLREMYRYVSGNPCFEFSVGGVLSILIPEVRANADINNGDWQPTKAEVTVVTAPDGTITVVETVEPEEVSDGPIKVDSSGIWVRGEDGYKSVCQLGLTKPVSMRRLDNSHIGYELEVTLDGASLGRKLLPMSAFTSKSQFNGWALNLGSAMKASDVTTSSLADTFRAKARNKGEPVFAVEREGIDIIVPPGSTDPNQLDVIWSAPDGVVSQGTVKYRFHGHYNDQGQFRTDLMMATPLTTADQDFFDDLLTINTDQNLAKLLGWFSAAFLTQIIRKRFGKFPILQVFGQAEAGKSHTIKLLANLHYYLKTPKTFAVAGMTPFPIIAATATSASIPVIFEEMKPRQLSKALKDLLQSIFRSNYTADELSRGSLGRDKAVRELTVTDYANAAPIAFVGEAIEDQSAILARCVVVALNKADRKGKRPQFERCMANPHVMGKLGKHMAMSALAIDSTVLHQRVQANLDMLADKLPEGQADETIRALFNLAVTLTGLNFMRETLAEVFGTRYDEKLVEMGGSLVVNVSDHLVKNMAEASRVLDVMAQMTRNPDIRFQLVRGEDYTINEDGKTMDLKLRTAFSKYVKHQRDLGMEVMFDTESAFISGMSNYAGTVQRSCPGNVQLYDSPKAVIYRLNLAVLDKEGVDAFK